MTTASVRGAQPADQVVRAPIPRDLPPLYADVEARYDRAVEQLLAKYRTQ